MIAPSVNCKLSMPRPARALFCLFVIFALLTSVAEARVQDLLRSMGANKIAFRVQPVSVTHQPTDTKKKVARKPKVTRAPPSLAPTAYATNDLYSTVLALTCYGEAKFGCPPCPSVPCCFSWHRCTTNLKDLKSTANKSSLLTGSTHKLAWVGRAMRIIVCFRFNHKRTLRWLTRQRSFGGQRVTPLVSEEGAQSGRALHRCLS